MPPLTLPQGRLFGAITESILFGINFVIFLGILALYGKQSRTRRTWWQRLRLAVICLIFILCIVHLAAVIKGLQLAFFEVPSATAFYNDRAQAVDLVQKAVYAVANPFSDGLLIYRMYRIFGNDWRAIIVPCISLFATLGVWAALIHTYKNSPPGSTLYFPDIERLAPTAFILSFITNVIITVMIALRIRSAIKKSQAVSKVSSRFYRTAIAYTIETGLLYPVALLVNGAFFLAKSNGLEILSGANTQFLGIVPNLLTLQTKLGFSLYDAAMGHSKSERTTVVHESIETTPRYNPGTTHSEGDPIELVLRSEHESEGTVHTWMTTGTQKSKDSQVL